MTVRKTEDTSVKIHQSSSELVKPLPSDKENVAQTCCGPRMRGVIGAACAVILLLLVAASTSAQTVKLEQGWQFLADKEGALSLDRLSNAQGWRDRKSVV